MPSPQDNFAACLLALQLFLFDLLGEWQIPWTHRKWGPCPTCSAAQKLSPTTGPMFSDGLGAFSQLPTIESCRFLLAFWVVSSLRAASTNKNLRPLHPRANQRFPLGQSNGLRILKEDSAFEAPKRPLCLLERGRNPFHTFRLT